MNLPGFELLEKLGEGGMATVWKARQISLNRTVAVKILSTRGASDENDAVRFQSEAQTMAALKHPGIIQVYDANVHEGVYYLVMEYVAGYSVGDWIRRKKLIPERDVLVTAECVAEALNYAWTTQRMIHCDIKPDNVIVDADGSLKVADLGLAKSIVAAGGRSDSNEIMGTPNYMSPEQITGGSELDCRTDMYSLGAMLYHMSTGQMLFQEVPDARAVMEKQVKDRAPDPLDLNPKLSMSTCWFIEKLLAKDRNQRHPDWSALLADIRLVKKGKMPAGRLPAEAVSTTRRSPKRVRAGHRRVTIRFGRDKAGGRRLGLLLLGGAVLALLAVPVFLPPPEPARPLPPPAAPAAPPARPSVEETKAAEMFDLAAQWTAANPENYDGAIERFGEVLKEAQGTKCALSAASKLAEIRAAKAKAVANALSALEGEIQRALSESNYGGAAALCRDYAGPFVRETADRRQELAEAAQQQQREVLSAQDREDRDRERNTAALIDAVAEKLLSSDVRTAVEALVATRKQERLEDVEALAKTEKLLRAAALLGDRILRSFTDQIGRTVKVALRDGTKTLTILGVADDKISCEETVAKANYIAARPMELTVSQLSLSETAGRLGAGEGEDLLLAKGLLAAREKAVPLARECFGRISPPLSSALLKKLVELSGREADWAAERALARFLKDLKVAVPDTYDETTWSAALSAAQLSGESLPSLEVRVDAYRKEYGHTGFAKNAGPLLSMIVPKAKTDAEKAIVDAMSQMDESALKRLLMNNNRNLSGNEIEIQKGRHYRGYRLAIHSERLTNLGALRTHGAGISELDVSRSRVKDLSVIAGTSIRSLDISEVRISTFPMLRSTQLARLIMTNSSLKDIAFVSKLKLQELNLAGTKVSDFRPLQRLSLEVLELSGTGVKDKDLEFIREQPIRSLGLRDSAISSLEPLRTMAIESLYLSGCAAVHDCTPLAELPLRVLDLRDTGIADLAALQRTPLEHLILAGTRITDLSPLKNTKLNTLDISQTGVTDLSPLAGMSLRVLYMSGTGIKTLSPLNDMPLTSLVISNTRVRDLSPLRGMPLESFFCYGIKPISWEPLIGMPLIEIGFDRTYSDEERHLLRSLQDLRRINGKGL